MWDQTHTLTWEPSTQTAVLPHGKEKDEHKGELMNEEGCKCTFDCLDLFFWLGAGRESKEPKRTFENGSK